MDELKLQCEDTADDYLHLEPDVGSVLVTCYQQGDTCAVYLDPERARQLFNWLGVWLHTQGNG